MKIAFIAPFFGKDAAGGAEFAARSVALHLAESGIDVDILTTCLKDLPSGITTNIHRAGVSQDGPLTIRRFRAESPNMANFGELNDFIIDGGQLSPPEELQFMARHVNSIDLLRYIAEHEADYHRLIFIPYLFGTTCFGIRIAPHKSLMIPCLHDEGYARLRIVQQAIQSARHLIFNARPEQVLANKLYRTLPENGTHIGLGVDTDIEFDADRFRHKFTISETFVLYAGRRDTTKNVHTLINNFEQFKKKYPGPLKLVLIGPADLPVANPSADIIDLGFVSEQEKRDAYAAAAVFCQPSLNESFSYVIMEAWLCGTPSLVHEECEVTRDHVVSSGGGLYFKTPADFNRTLNHLLSNKPEYARMAAAGRNYVIKNFAWQEIVRKYRQVLSA